MLLNLESNLRGFHLLRKCAAMKTPKPFKFHSFVRAQASNFKRSVRLPLAIKYHKFCTTPHSGIVRELQETQTQDPNLINEVSEGISGSWHVLVQRRNWEPHVILVSR